MQINNKHHHLYLQLDVIPRLLLGPNSTTTPFTNRCDQTRPPTRQRASSTATL